MKKRAQMKVCQAIKPDFSNISLWDQKKSGPPLKTGREGAGLHLHLGWNPLCCQAESE